MGKILAVLFVLTFGIFSFAADSTPHKLVIVGDSLTEGYGVAREAAYPALLEKKILAAGKNWSVINSGISGSTTASAPGRITWALKSKPDLIMIALGGNDVLRGLPLTESEKNLRKALQSAQDAHVQALLAGIRSPPNYGKDYDHQLAEMYQRLAHDFHLHLMPFLLEGVAGHPELVQGDGLHPNEKGHEIVAEHVWAFLKGNL